MCYQVKFFLLDGHIPLEQSYETLLSGTGPEAQVSATVVLKHRGKLWLFSVAVP